MKQPLISIIIPVYNVESYIDECLESVVTQTYKNLEIIVVDDGSTDSSGEKCDRWKEKDKRIHVIHKQHEEVSDARNVGLGKATGDYIGFVDSDDVIHEEMYQRLYELIQETGYEISSCAFQRDTVFVNLKKVRFTSRKLKKYNTQQALEAVVKESDIHIVIWNKLYKRSILQGIMFEKNKCHEDEFWSYQVIGQAHHIVSTNECLYGYRQRANSIMHQKYSLRNLDLLEAREQRLGYFEKNFPALVSLGKSNLRFECIRAMQYTLLYFEGNIKKEAKNKILSVVKRHPLRYADYQELPFGRQIWCGTSNFSFMGVCRFRNLLNDLTQSTRYL